MKLNINGIYLHFIVWRCYDEIKQNSIPSHSTQIEGVVVKYKGKQRNKFHGFHYFSSLFYQLKQWSITPLIFYSIFFRQSKY